MMTLLLQLNGDLPDRFPGHERRLYIFACREKSCRRKEGSIRGIRAVRVSKTASGGNNKKKKKEEAPPKPVHQHLGNAIFGSNPPLSSGNAGTNPFSSTSSTQHFNPFSPSASPYSLPTTSSPIAPKPAQQPSEQETLPKTFAQKVRLSAPPAPSRPPSPWPEDSALPQPYPSYYLDAEYESLDVQSPKPSPSQRAQFDSTPSSSTNDSAEEAGAFESSLDKTFHRFADRLAQNPLQVLRYEFAGSPLLYSKTDPVGHTFSPLPPANSKIITMTTSGNNIPRCGNCTSERVFEVQLTPQTIAELEVGEDGIEGMEWGNVVLGVCSVDCEAQGVEKGQVGWVEEWVGVQWEDVGGMHHAVGKR